MSVTIDAFLIKHVRTKYGTSSDIIAFYNNFVVLILFTLATFISQDFRLMKNLEATYPIFLVALAGGMPVQLLREGTKQQNIDYVKNIIDECGREGIMFMPSQGLLSPGDVNVDNLRATIDFIHEYTS